MTLTVGELREALSEFPNDMEILLPKDDEGNGFRKLHYAPSIYYINKNDVDSYEIESIIAEDELKNPNDEDFDEWEHTDPADVEPRLIIG